MMGAEGKSVQFDEHVLGWRLPLVETALDDPDWLNPPPPLDPLPLLPLNDPFPLDEPVFAPKPEVLPDEFAHAAIALVPRATTPRRVRIPVRPKGWERIGDCMGASNVYFALSAGSLRRGPEEANVRRKMVPCAPIRRAHVDFPCKTRA